MRPKSEKIYNESLKLIPGGVNSPVRSFKNVDLLPLIAERGTGSKITDIDGNIYLDFCCSWGALIHGHAHPSIVERVIERVKKGSSFGISTEIEQKMAQKVLSLLPHIEKVRFVSSGTEATMSAIRLARAYTKKDIIIKFEGHYHGHADHFLVKGGSGLAHIPTASSAGIPQDVVKNTITLPFNDIDALKKVFSSYKNIAAVILEPIAANMGVVLPKKGFLEFLREETAKQGTLLIFDEVITGFRTKKQSVDADLYTLGKIIGGGFPCAAFGGRRDIMDFLAPLGPVYQAGTLSGNPVAMEAGLASLDLLSDKFYEDLKEKTQFFLEPIAQFIEKNDLEIALNYCDSMFTFFFGTKTVDSF